MKLHKDLPFIECKDLTLSQAGKQLTKGFSVTICGGEALAVTGPSGSGKTTFIRALLGLVTPTEGTVRFSGKRAAVFQEPRLVRWLSAEQNVRLGKPGTDVWKRKPCTSSLDLLRALGLSDVTERRADELSGGMQRRVSVARALYSGAQIIIADEPFAHLDAESAMLVANALEAARSAGAVLVLSAHKVGFEHRSINNFHSLSF
ncbi:MAG: ATP-binding cassette domain-containing protein [Mycobacteriaceae bacterium]